MTTKEHKNLLPVVPGFRPSVITEEQWNLGGVTGIAGVPLSSGHWLKEGHVPEGEQQANPFFDSYNCTGFGYTNRIEILWHRLYGVWRNFSDRWVGIVSGTEYQKGNDPQAVAEAVRKNGLIDEADLPFDVFVKTPGEFYSPRPPTSDLVEKAKQFLIQHEPQHDWVGKTPQELMEALKYSPLGVAVVAWYRDDEGYYYFPEGMLPNHDSTIMGYEEGEYWLLIDSYPDESGSFFKKLRWNSKFAYNSKRYALGPGISQKITWIQKIIEILSRVITLRFLIDKKEPPVSPTEILPENPSETMQKTPETMQNMVRRVAREERLSPEMQERLYKVVQWESNFDPKAINRNKNGTIDFGICQFNSGKNSKGIPYWIGEGAVFPNSQYVLDNPEHCVQVMAREFRLGHQHYWVGYRRLYPLGALASWIMEDRYEVSVDDVLPPESKGRENT